MELVHVYVENKVDMFGCSLKFGGLRKDKFK